MYSVLVIKLPFIFNKWDILIEIFFIFHIGQPFGFVHRVMLTT